MIRLLFATAVLLATVAPSQARTLEYLYVEPNAGGGSGGHVALRVGEVVYHYQNPGDGMLRMTREGFDFFRYAYTVLQNRTIHVNRIAADDDLAEALRSRFNTRYVVEQAHFRARDALRRDRQLLELARARAAGEAPATPRVGMRGAGFFFGPRESPRHDPAPRLVALRERLREQRGPDFPDARIAEIERELAGLPLPGPEARVPLSRDRLPAAASRFSARVLDLNLERLALVVIRDALPLREAAQRTGVGPAFALRTRERDLLGSYALSLEASLGALLDSSRADRGFPLLVGLARLVAIDASVRSGRLVVLDAFSPQAAVIPASVVRRRGAFAREILAWAGERYVAERRGLAARDRIRERHYAALEEVTNRYLEIRRGVDEGRDIRVDGETLVPTGLLERADLLLLPRGTVTELAAAAAASRERESAREAALAELYRYDLLGRNCVSELFDTINASLPAEELAERLGAPLGEGRSLDFIPAVAFSSVGRRYPISARGEIPSYRRERLEQMYARENPLLVYLRETNTLTSTVYRENPHDAFFLFFTDDAVIPRPLLGAVNFVAGLGEAALGLLRLPFDGGRTLWSGARGSFFSLPELAFVNLRKGTFQYGRSHSARTRLRSED